MYFEAAAAITFMTYLYNTQVIQRRVVMKAMDTPARLATLGMLMGLIVGMMTVVAEPYVIPARPRLGA